LRGIKKAGGLAAKRHRCAIEPTNRALRKLKHPVDTKLVSQVTIGPKELLLQGSRNFAAPRELGKQSFSLTFTLANQAEENIIPFREFWSNDIGTKNRDTALHQRPVQDSVFHRWWKVSSRWRSPDCLQIKFSSKNTFVEFQSLLAIADEF